MRLHSIAVVTFVMTASAACTTQGAEPDDPPSEQPDASSPPEVSTEEAALEAYESMWSVLVEESHHVDPDYSDLELYASGDALALVEHGLNAEAEDGFVSRGEPTFSPEAAADDDELVTIEDCMDSTSWLREDGETGELVEPSPEDPILRQVDATVDFDGLSWKVTDLRIWESGSCDG
ncbi:hypothetical protein [Nocardiopsis synnemataformans]|uniref:hypothetical protein n=1 Tax=Nocardiopsis synnemataformans TaxID=61305 RepID=UPI003EBC2868